MNKTRIYLLVPALALVVSFFLPYISIGGITGLDVIGEGGNALLLLVGALAMVAGALLPKPKAKFGAPYQWVYLAGSAAATLFFVLLLVRGSDAIRAFGRMSFDVVGIGAWVGLIAGVAGVALTFTYKKLT